MRKCEISDKVISGFKKEHMHIFRLEAHVKFQKDLPKTVGGVSRKRCILAMLFCSTLNSEKK